MSKENIHKTMMSGNQMCPIDKNYKGPLDKHHINGRKVKNWDGEWNVVYVSPNTHRLIHEGEIIIEGWFTTSDGRELIWHRKNEKSITGENSEPHKITRKF